MVDILNGQFTSKIPIALMMKQCFGWFLHGQWMRK